MNQIAANSDRVIPGPGAVSITPRNIRFVKALPKAATWLGGDLTASSVFNSMSLVFPEAERLLIDAVRAYKPVLEGPLLEDANNFIAQEAIHSREHVSLNKMMDPTHYPVKKIRELIRKDHAKDAARGALMLVATASALEHFTAMLGDTLLRNVDIFADSPEDVRRLWLWHAIEETEHKAVIFDVFSAVAKDMPAWRRYMTRLKVMILATIEITKELVWYSALLLHADGMSKPKSLWNVLWFLFGKPGFIRVSMKGYWKWYRPGFHPWQHDNRALVGDILAELNEEKAFATL